MKKTAEQKKLKSRAVCPGVESMKHGRGCGSGPDLTQGFQVCMALRPTEETVCDSAEWAGSEPG